MTKNSEGIALITGGARRIGRGIALELARAGWDVAIHYGRSEKDAADLSDEIAAMGCRAETLHADLAHEPDVETLIERVSTALGPVTCLVNNASVFENDSAETASRESWDRHMEVNLRAPFVLMQSFARLLPEDRTGNIINVLDERVWNLTPHFLSYTLSKSALWTLTQTLALALAPRIRVNAIGPGPTLPSPRQTPEQFERQAGLMPLGRGTSPEEIADAARFILAAPAMTGQMIALDGGQHLGWEQTRPGATPDVE